MVKNNAPQIKFRRVPHLDDLELLHVTDATYDYPRHIHEEYSVVLMLRGAETTTYREKSYTALPGDLLLINADEAHSSKSAESEYIVIKIKTKTINRIAFEVFGRHPKTPFFPIPVVKDSKMFRLLLNLYAKLGCQISPLEQKSEFVSTIGRLIKRQNKTNPVFQPSGKEHYYIRLAQDYLKSHYSENVSLEKLSSATNLSPFHLLRVFRNLIGVPPHEYQTQLRIAKARKLIRQGLSISEAALETGFFDQSHLSRNFKRITGRTPGKYLSEQGKILR